MIKEDIFAPPPTCDYKEIMDDFRACGLYSEAFLAGLERGLKRSPYFKKEDVHI